MNTISTDQFRAMLESALSVIKKNEVYLSQLDAVTGDGDHGTAIVTALYAAVAASGTETDFDKMFNEIGFGIMLNTSGSTSTLLGGFFLGMADGASGTLADAGQFKSMFQKGLAGVAKNTKASVGDKTMMDALIPAVAAMTEAESDDIAELLAAGATAARIGAGSTITMKANFGRARNYGDRSVGTMDAGAASWAIILEAFAKYCTTDAKE